MKKTYVLGSILMIGILIGNFNIFAQSSAGKRETARCAKDMATFFRDSEGARPAKVDQDFLEKTDDYINYRMILQQGNTYIFTVCGERSFKDLDIKIYDREGYLVVKDQKKGKRPVLRFQPSTTGPFIIKVLASQGHGAYSFLSLTK